MLINLVYDSRAQAAPQSFRDGIQAAANVLDASFSDNITLNIEIGYGEYPGDGTPETHGSASAAPANGIFVSYTQVRSWLAQNLSSDVQTGVAALPTGASIQGQTQVAVWTAQERLMGQISATDPRLDGYAGFATDIAANELEGVALHELTHAMGRVTYGPQPDIMDLFRFTSVGTRLFTGTLPASASYFSLNGGTTDLADYGRTSDDSDFLNSSGRTPNDAFNEFYNASTTQALTSMDLLQMESLGFHARASSPGSVSINNVSVLEGNNGTQLVVFTVTRSGGTAPFSVNYATADGTAAVAGNDYVSTSGTLTFGSGVNTQTVSVTVNGDRNQEPDESFLVSLSGATNGAVISNATASCTLMNDDVANSDFFGGVTHDPTSSGGEIYEFYDGLLGRAPDPLSYEQWVSTLQNGMSLHDIASGFLASGEFTSRFGAYTQLSNQQFVQDLYQAVLRRPPDAQGLQNWMNALASGTSRADVAVAFVTSPEHQQNLGAVFNAGVFVPSSTDCNIARLYYSLLDRAPDAAGLLGWENAAAQGTSLSAIAQSFIGSPEYQNLHGQQSNQQFVDALYQAALGRAPDAAGEQGWLAALGQGSSRAAVALGFASSGEAQQHLAANIEIGFSLA